MRVKSIFRRIEFEKKQNYDKYSNSIDMELKFGDVIINKKNKIVTSKNVNIDLTPNEYNLLTYLFENIDRAVS
ncbi:DNA-binding response regulator, partial [Clostridioides difficile]